MTDPKTSTCLVQVSSDDDPAKLLDGQYDALLRPPITSHPGLHLDQVVLQASCGATVDATLALRHGSVPEDPAAQMEQAFQNLGHVLKAAGAMFDHVVDLTAF